MNVEVDESVFADLHTVTLVQQSSYEADFREPAHVSTSGLHVYDAPLEHQPVLASPSSYNTVTAVAVSGSYGQSSIVSTLATNAQCQLVAVPATPEGMSTINRDTSCIISSCESPSPRVTMTAAAVPERNDLSSTPLMLTSACRQPHTNHAQHLTVSARSSMPLVGVINNEGGQGGHALPGSTPSNTPRAPGTLSEKLEYIRNAVDRLEATQTRILEYLENIPSKSPESTVEFDLGSTTLPVSSEEDMEHLSQHLQNKNTRKQLVC